MITVDDVRTGTIDPDRALVIKEERAAAVIDRLDREGLPVVSLSLNLPGDQGVPLWDEFWRGLVPTVERHLRAWPLECERTVAVRQFPEKKVHHIVLRGDIIAIKMAAVAFEAERPAWRLADLDVYDPVTRLPVDRASLQLPQRACIICQNTARACFRAQRHTADEFWTAVAGLLNSP